MKAQELLDQVKDLCLYTGTTRDNQILQRLHLNQLAVYNMPYHWRGLEQSTDLYTTELMTLDVAPSTRWSVGDTITGASSGKTCVIVDMLSTLTYNVRSRSGTFTKGEILSNGTYTADQGTSYPTFTNNSYIYPPSDLGLVYTIRQMSVTPYAKLRYVQPHKFHEYIPQPTMYAYNKPLYYTWFAGRIWFYPIPDATYQLTMYYYKRPTPLKLYSTGTISSFSGVTATGSSTYWLNNKNVEAGMFLTIAADKLADGTYPWAKIATVTANTTLTTEYAYSNYGSSTTGAYIASSDSVFPGDFDPYLIYTTAMMEVGRNREIGQLAAFLKDQIGQQLAGLIDNQTSIPDQYFQTMDFAREPVLLGDDYAKFPFIQSAP